MRITTWLVWGTLLGTALSGCLQGGEPTRSVTLPVAFASAEPTTALVGQAVRFTSEGSDTGGSDRAVFLWEFGDGERGTGPTTTHSYSLPGEYIVRLTVSNEKGNATNEAALLYVSVTASEDFTRPLAELAPVARIVVERPVLSVGGSVVVNGSLSHGYSPNEDFNPSLGITPDNLPATPDPSAITSWRWSWGDSSAASEGVQATHVYSSSGLYVLTLTVTDKNGRSSSAAQTILVLPVAPAVGGFKNKDLFVTATISGPQSFDPGFDYETAGGAIIENVYERLFGADRGNTNRLLPILAEEIPSKENGGISPDGLTYTIKIRKGVRFHDGTPLDAQAVKFSLDRLVLLNDPSSGAPVITAILKGADDYRAHSNNTAEDRARWLSLNAVEVKDTYTVVLHLERRDAAVLQRLAFAAASIVSPAAFKACHPERVPLWGVCTTPDGLPPPTVGDKKAVTRDPWADANMVGTGPFKLRKWIPGDRVILDRNEDYWGTKPKLKTVVVQYVDDLNTRILLFKNGDADEIYIPSSDLDRVRPSIESLARFVPADTLVIDAVFFNYHVEAEENCPKVAGVPDCDLFQDPKVREAFAYAFDYDSFFKDVWKGRAKPLAGVIPRGMPGYDPDLAPYTRDVVRARAALESSKCRNGCEVDVYYNTGNNVRKGGAQILKQSLESLSPNVKVNVRELPFNTLLDKTQKKEIPLWFLGWAPDYIATDDYIYPFYHSQGNYPIQQNFRDGDLDSRIEEALSETDPVRQAELYKEINHKAVEKIVDIFLDQRTQTHVERTYVHGYYYSPLHSGAPNVGDYSTIYKE